MGKTSYSKDTKKFWQEHKHSKSLLDKSRSKASQSEKKLIQQTIENDIEFLKTGRILSSDKN
jgi:hypothetical protein